MQHHSITATADEGPIPADDPARTLRATPPDDTQAPYRGGACADTNGRYCLIDMLVPDGSFPPPHRHDFEEMFTLLEGALEFTFRGEAKTTAAPATVNIPANAPHQFKNLGQDGPHALLVRAGRAGGVLHGRGRALGEPRRPRAAIRPRRLAKELSPRYRTEMTDHA